MKVLRLALAASLVFTSSVFSQTPVSRTIVLHADRMITIASPTVVRNAAVIVTDDRIVAAGSASTISTPSGAQVIELGDVTLLPGFIDAHTHIIGRTPGDPMADLSSVKDYVSDRITDSRDDQWSQAARLG